MITFINSAEYERLNESIDLMIGYISEPGYIGFRGLACFSETYEDGTRDISCKLNSVFSSKYKERILRTSSKLVISFHGRNVKNGTYIYIESFNSKYDDICEWNTTDLDRIPLKAALEIILTKMHHKHELKIYSQSYLSTVNLKKVKFAYEEINK